MTTPTDEAARRRKDWINGAAAVPRRRCSTCGAAFYTTVGLDEHARVGCGDGAGSPVQVSRSQAAVEAAHAAKREAGRAQTALDGISRVQCDECGQVSTPSGLGVHQRATGHVGRSEVA